MFSSNDQRQMHAWVSHKMMKREKEKLKSHLKQYDFIHFSVSENLSICQTFWWWILWISIDLCSWQKKPLSHENEHEFKIMLTYYFNFLLNSNIGLFKWIHAFQPKEESFPFHCFNFVQFQKFNFKVQNSIQLNQM